MEIKIGPLPGLQTVRGRRVCFASLQQVAGSCCQDKFSRLYLGLEWSFQGRKMQRFQHIGHRSETGSARLTRVKFKRHHSLWL